MLAEGERLFPGWKELIPPWKNLPQIGNFTIGEVGL